MSPVAQIEEEIEKLDAEAFGALREWFLDHMHTRWDEQIEADSAAGKLDFLVEEALEAENRGETRPL